MRVLITGASGFIGSRLARALLAAGTLPGAGGAPQPLRELILLDRLAADPALAGDRRVHAVQGDLADPTTLRALCGPGIDTVFALGAASWSEIEADDAQAIDVNVHGMLRLLDCCRAQPRRPTLVFTSSIAAFGGPLPEVVDDDQPLTPQTTYGTHKAVVELLVNDASRRGTIDGRTLRLPVVMVRPGPPSSAISDRISAVVREPLHGHDTPCLLQPQTRVPLVSADAAAQALIAVQALPAAAYGHTRAMNLPSLSVTIAELVDAVQNIARWRTWSRPLGQVHWRPDAAVQTIVDAWPKRLDSARARELGIVGDTSLHEIIEHFISDHLAAAA